MCMCMGICSGIVLVWNISYRQFLSATGSINSFSGIPSSINNNIYTKTNVNEKL